MALYNISAARDGAGQVTASVDLVYDEDGNRQVTAVQVATTIPLRYLRVATEFKGETFSLEPAPDPATGTIAPSVWSYPLPPGTFSLASALQGGRTAMTSLPPVSVTVGYP